MLPPAEIGAENIPKNIPATWAGTDSEWFERTGHCGRCGNPGEYCTCTKGNPCGCADLHDMGSARLPAALEAFMPVIVTIDQPDLFGGTQ
jgi:hypothetical protein